MTNQHIDELINIYRGGLLNDVLPFWVRHCVDHERGGFFSALNRDGSILDTDKSVWVQGRFTWLLATLYSDVEQRPEWLALASHGIDFIRKHGFDRDGRMFFQVTRDGRPLRKRRYVYSEMFAAMALAAYAKASGDEVAADEANRLLRLVLRYVNTPGLLPSKGIPETRQTKSIGVPMMIMHVAQVLREAIDDEPLCTETIDRCIGEIRDHFLKPDLECVMETVGPNGEVYDGFDGRMLNPGHAIEAAWFILHEARRRDNDPELVQLGCRMLDWMWRRGWDPEHGGILYFVDLEGLPVQEYWHDMKMWWPQNETIIATLLAYHLSHDEKYADWHEMAHCWAYDRFPDAEFGEWFGYLHRDGGLSVPLKGNMWKGPYHIPRMQWYCWRILEEIKRDRQRRNTT